MRMINVFIPAAGRGERLRPLTDHLPKPLMPIMGRPLLDIIAERLSVLPVRRIGVNMSHKWQMIRDWADTSPLSTLIELFHERQMLGTGGALRNAATLLAESIFLVHNSDVVSDLDLNRLLEAHVAGNNIATLAVHDYPRFNNVWVDSGGMVRKIGKGIDEAGLRPVAFTGIAVYSPSFLDLLRDGASEVVDAWRLAISRGLGVATADFTGCFWRDIGSPASYLETVLEILQKEGETVYVHPSVDCGRFELAGPADIEEDCVVEGAPRIRNSILLPGAHVSRNGLLENSIAGPGFIIEVDDPLSGQQPSSRRDSGIGGLPMGLGAVPIGTGGSDRRYYRVGKVKKTLVLLESPSTDPDYERLLEYALFFERCGLPTARLIPEGPETPHRLLPKGGPSSYAFFEDLGDLSLYAWLRCRRGDSQIEEVYRKILDVLVKVQTEVTGRVHECPMLCSRIFDYDHLRWETDYFLGRFVQGLLGLEIQDRQQLDVELDSLAHRVDGAKKTLIHRDLQSQNIMIKDGIPHLIDYQGARIGPPAYDIASLLWDPYFVLSGDLRDRLLHYYLDNRGLKAGLGESEFREGLLFCRLQRHMQALGAYGFLSVVKGKKYFLKHVPVAVRYLSEEAELAGSEYPVLRRLITAIRVCV